MRFPPQTIAIVLLLAAGCSTDHLPGVASDHAALQGVVRGRVLDEQGGARAFEFVSVHGSNFVAFTDSTGRFVLYNMPEGQYDLAVADTTIAVVVTAGDTTVLPDLVLPLQRPVARKALNVDVAKLEVSQLRDGDRFVWVGRSSDLDPRAPVEIDADTLVFRCVVVEIDLAGAEPVTTPTERQTRVTRNGEAIFKGFARKGRVETPPIVPTGHDLVVIEVERIEVARFLVVDSAHAVFPPRNHLLITTEEATLTPRRVDARGSSYDEGPMVALGSDTFRIGYERYSRTDWDLFVVNDSTGDTCSWRNVRPDWGAANQGEDDPEFSGDSWDFGYESDQPKDSYSADRVSVFDAAPGTYSIFVRLFDTAPGEMVAVPTISVEIGLNEDGSRIDRFYQSTCAQTMVPGETWYAGKVLFPAGRYDPRGQRVLPAVVGMDKRHRTAGR